MTAIIPARTGLALCLALLATACVTINVYFPAAAAEKAADRIIRDVYGGETPASEPPAEQTPGAEIEPTSRRGAAAPLVAVLDWLVPPAQAAGADISVQTPAIQRIKAAMARRHQQLQPFYASGAVGMTNDGLLAVRDLGAVPLKDRRQVNELVAEENRDRTALYREIARANGHPEWEDEIRATFARRWVDNAPGGWWHQGPGGGWKRK